MMADFQGDITMHNILPNIIHSNSIKFPDNVKDTIRDDYPDLDIKDMESLFIAYNDYLEESERKHTNIKPLFIIMKDFQISPMDVWTNRKEIQRVFNEEFTQLRENVRSDSVIAGEFDNIEPIEALPFEEERIQYTLIFGPTEMTIEEVFNNCVCSDLIPYIVMDTVYKVRRDFTPTKEWLDDKIENAVLIKMDNERPNQTRKLKDQYKRYSNVVFGIVDGVLMSTLTLNLSKRNMTRDEFTRKFIEEFPRLNLTILSSENVSVSGHFIFPHQTLDLVVWSELSMNNSTFNNLIAIDESIRASKIKQNIYFHVLSSGKAASIQMKTISKFGEYPDLLEGDKYVKVRIPKMPTIESVEAFQTLLGRLFTLYNKLYNNTVQYYLHYIPNFTPVPLKIDEELTPKTLSLRDIAPDVFFPNYTRKCTQPPDIISDEEVASAPHTVMTFPIRGESTPRNYTCPNESHSFIGLRDNPLDNRDLFPYIPCCYKKNQMTQKGSKYRNYFLDEKLKKKMAQSQEFFVTGKIVPPQVLGKLPPTIAALFNTLTTPNFQFMRRGMSHTPMSFVEAVLTALGHLNGTEKNLVQILARERKRLSTLSYAAASKQELYNLSVHEILHLIQTDDLRATRFVRTVEQAYDCCIFIFTSTPEGGIMVVPPHAQCYYKLTPQLETILIYQHWGTESNVTDYPQCELIVKAVKKNIKEQVTSFSPNSSVTARMYETFKAISEKYKFSKEVSELKLRRFPIVSQYIDTYGKLRIINTTFSRQMITIVTDPLPPFARPVSNEIWRVKTKTVYNMIVSYGFAPVLQRIDPLTDRTREIVVMIGTVAGTFLVDDTEVIDGLEIQSGEMYKVLTNTNVNTPVDTFNVARKTARVIIQYGLRTAAILANSKPNKTLEDEDFARFASKSILIDPNVVYNIDLMRPVFSKDNESSNVITPDGRIVLPSEEIALRLVYSIKMYQKLHKDDFMAYPSLVNIPGFYRDVSDFTRYSSEYILNGEQAVINVIDTKTTDRKSVPYVRKKLQRPYFFKNPLLPDVVYLAQNAPTFLIANKILSIWMEKDYNPGLTPYVLEKDRALLSKTTVDIVVSEDDDEDIEDLIRTRARLDIDTPTTSTVDTTPFKRQKVNVYRYFSETNITPVSVVETDIDKDGNGINSKSQNIILGYRVAGVPRYTILFSV